MTGLTGLAAVLALHDVWDGDAANGFTCEGCGHRLGGPTDNLDAAYHAHVAAAVTAWLAEWLGSEEAREAVADELTDANWCESNYTRGCNCRDWKRQEADAALTAVLAALEVER